MGTRELVVAGLALACCGCAAAEAPMRSNASVILFVIASNIPIMAGMAAY